MQYFETSSDAEFGRHAESNTLSLSYGSLRALPQPALPLAAFDAQVRKQPQAIAVQTESRELTYGELARLSWLVSMALAARGGRTVAICLERSVELVAAIVGVVRAGRAYLPLDVESPPARIRELLADSGTSLVLTDKTHAGLFSLAEPNVTILFVDEILAGAELDIRDFDHDDDRLAYVIYTSGSTGKPKGVAVSLRSLWNRIDWMQRAFPLDVADGVLQKTPYTFDVSVWEFFWPLMFGARMVVAPPGKHRDPEFLMDFIERHAVSVLHFVPSMLDVFLQLHRGGRCPSVRLTFCSGEAISFGLIERFCRQFPHSELINLYGPTEAAIDVTWWDCRSARESSTPPIGKPIQNMQTLILNAEQRPTKVGEVGELHLSGVGLAHGYINDPTLTNAFFIPNPFGKSPDYARLYRTGDLARWLPSGNIEYLGRNDDQVKIGGQRIELAEINAAIERDARVSVACTLKHGERLVAFVRASDFASFSEAELKESLRSVLPPFMLPHRIVAVRELPVTANGKTDRQRLLAHLEKTDASMPAIPGAELSGNTAAVLTRLRRIWSAVLELPEADIDVEKSFFELGGDSLAMLRVVARGKQEGLNVSLRELNEHPFLAALAAVVAGEAMKPAAPPPVPNGGTAGEWAAKLRKVWAEVLRTSEHEIAEDAGFFELGGDSLAMLRVVARCRELGVPLSLRELNDQPVLSSLVLLLAAKGDSGNSLQKGSE